MLTVRDTNDVFSCVKALCRLDIPKLAFAAPITAYDLIAFCCCVQYLLPEAITIFCWLIDAH